MDNAPPAVGACSACAGDYEDPDRTAWMPDGADEDDDGGAEGPVSVEFPAEQYGIGG